MTVADDLRVLIVDDEELSRSLLSSIVGEAAGYVVADVKRNGREAIESLQRRVSISFFSIYRCRD